MREPPNLADRAIIAALHAHYGLSVTTLTFLPLGADSASAVYRVDADDGTANLLKARWERYLALDEMKAKQRMVAFLLRRGFPRGVVWEVVEQALRKGKKG